jgi:hypothetical protein
MTKCASTKTEVRVQHKRKTKPEVRARSNDGWKRTKDRRWKKQLKGKSKSAANQRGVGKVVCRLTLRNAAHPFRILRGQSLRIMHVCGREATIVVLNTRRTFKDAKISFHKINYAAGAGSCSKTKRTKTKSLEKKESTPWGQEAGQNFAFPTETSCAIDLWQAIRCLCYPRNVLSNCVAAFGALAGGESDGHSVLSPPIQGPP